MRLSLLPCDLFLLPGFVLWCIQYRSRFRAACQLFYVRVKGGEFLYGTPLWRCVPQITFESLRGNAAVRDWLPHVYLLTTAVYCGKYCCYCL